MQKIGPLELLSSGLAGAAPIPALLGWQVPLAPSLKILAASALTGGLVWMLRKDDLSQTRDDRDAGRYLVGRQRSGKTTLASLWFQEDIRSPHSWTHRPIPWLPFRRTYTAQNDRGAAWITTHGAKSIAALVPEESLTLISPPKTHGVNVMAGGDPYSAANRVATIMARMWPDLGDNQKPLLYTAALTVAQERPGATLWDLLRFIDDPQERRLYVIESEIAERAWANPEKQAVRGLVSRIGRMLASPRLSRGLADADGIDLDREVRLNRVIVADLVQDDTADALVLAQAIVNMLQQVGVRRPDSAPTYPVYLDEFQSYADRSVETWITEGGKRHMPLTVIHQTRKQLDSKSALSAATLSCGTIYCMACNIHDARELSSELGVDDPTTLTAQRPRYYRARILTRGRIAYRGGRVPYVDPKGREDSAGHRADRRADDLAGGEGALPAHGVIAEDGAEAASGLA